MRLLASVYGMADRAGRAVGMEKEHLEDLLAEARAKYESDRARETRDPEEATRAVPASVVPMRGRAA